MYELYEIAYLIKIEPFNAQTYLHMIEKAVNKAITQHERIIQDDLTLGEVIDSLFKTIRQARMKRAIPSPLIMDELNLKKKKIMITLFSDVHHYLICWAEVSKLYDALRKAQPFFEAMHKRFLKSLREHRDFRNHLEHIDDRVEKGISDLGNLANGKFTFNKKQLDISETDLQTLKDFYETLIKIAHEKFEQPFV